MHALVTGAGGFVGRHLVARLHADGWTVTALTRDRVDLTDPVAATAVVRAADPEVVFSLAAARQRQDAAARAATTAVNTSPWLVDALGPRCRAVVRLGSSTEYAARDRPLTEDGPLSTDSFFGATKAAGSLLLLAAAAQRGVRATVLRAFQVYGPGDHPDRFVPVVLEAAARGRRVPLTAPGRRRDWVWVGDVVEACVRAATADHLSPATVVNVGTGVQTANEELVALAERATGRRIGVDVGAHEGRAWDTEHWVADPTRARELLGWEPTVPLAEGLRRTWRADHAVAA
jgi:nucleoside-diphosphate-sugar epimerase